MSRDHFFLIICHFLLMSVTRSFPLSSSFISCHFALIFSHAALIRAWRHLMFAYSFPFRGWYKYRLSSCLFLEDIRSQIRSHLKSSRVQSSSAPSAFSSSFSFLLFLVLPVPISNLKASLVDLYSPVIATAITTTTPYHPLLVYISTNSLSSEHID